jgi:hypothetical protein
MDIKQYWSDLDSRLDTLVKNGCVKLPSLAQFQLDDIAANITNDLNGSTFAELCPSHELFLRELNIAQELTPKLFDIARNVMGYKGDLENQYHIARRVEPGNSKEMFRAHFDSHLFTLVLPIKIPTAVSGGTAGDLIYFPSARKLPGSEINNFIGKVAHKRFASKKGMERYSRKHNVITDNFLDHAPLLFMGSTTLHTNKQVSSNCSSYRLSLLAHFFDPSPKYGVGGLMRLWRKR